MPGPFPRGELGTSSLQALFKAGKLCLSSPSPQSPLDLLWVHEPFSQLVSCKLGWLMCHNPSPEWVCRAARTEAEAPKTPTAPPGPCPQKSCPHLTEAWEYVLALPRSCCRNSIVANSSVIPQRNTPTPLPIPSAPWAGTNTEFFTRALDDLLRSQPGLLSGSPSPGLVPPQHSPFWKGHTRTGGSCPRT